MRIPWSATTTKNLSAFYESSNAAYFADKIKTRTRLIGGTKDPDAKRGAQKWKERESTADTQPYDGGHNFYGDSQFDNVTGMVVGWLMEEPAIKRMAKRKAP